MQREPAAFLWDVHQATLRIREFVAGGDFNTYKGSYLVQSAVERQFEIIGEALNQLSKGPHRSSLQKSQIISRSSLSGTY
jgi:uncharacterized protein with HEPN domain